MNAPDFPVWLAPGSADGDQEDARTLGIEWRCERPETGLWLERDQGVLSLFGAHETPFHAELESQRTASSRPRDALPRSIGLHRRSGLSVVDATAGWCSDAATLAILGANVLAFERHPIPFALTKDALHRVTAPWREHLELRFGDATMALESGQIRADVVLLDPMFPERRGRQVRKASQILRRLAPLPTEPENERLLAAARSAAPRVVVKRHRHAPHLADATPSLSVDAQRVRFDVYLAPGGASD